MQKNLRIKPLLWFAAPYLLILLILAGLSVVITNSAYTLLLEQTVANNAKSLTYAMDALEHTMASLDSLNNTLIRDKKIKKVLSAADRTSHLSALLQYLSEPLRYSDSNGIMARYVVYGRKADAILTKDNAMLHPERYYTAMLQYGDMTWNEWHDEILRPDYQDYFYPAKPARAVDALAPQRYILYTKPYSDTETGRIEGRNLFYLNESALLSMLSALDGDGIQLQLFWGDMLLLSSGPGEFDFPLPDKTMQTGGLDYKRYAVNGQGFYRADAALPEHNLRMVAWLPHDMLMRQCHEQLKIVNALILLLMALVTGVAIVSVLRNRSPLKGISRFTQSFGGMGSIERALYKMQDDQNALSLELEKQNEKIRESFFRQLIYGFSGSESDFDVQLSHAGVRFLNGKPNIRAVYLRMTSDAPIESEDEIRAITYRQTLVERAIREHTANLSLLLWEEHNRLALLYYEDSDLLTPLHQIYQRLNLASEINVAFYLSAPFSGLKNAHYSFREARRLMLTDAMPSERFLVDGGLQKQTTVFYYSSSDEERLLAAIERVDMEEIAVILGEIYRMNFEKQSLTAQMCELLYYRMVSTLVNSPHSIPIALAELMTPQGDLVPSRFFDTYRRHIDSMCLHIVSETKKTDRLLSDRILAYINEHMADKNLCITELVMRFGFSESYISQHIKKLAGKPFLNYLEALRITRAKELLQEGNLKISEISDNLGYNSLSAFGRAYKRVVGYTPSEYQKYYRARRLKNEQQPT